MQRERSSYRWFLVATASIVVARTAFGDGGFNNVPMFTSHSPLIQFIDINTGQNSLLITGTAMDPDVDQFVRFVPSGVPPFMQFQSINGNPGEFRITADNLRSHLGEGYSFNVVVVDSFLPPQVDVLSFYVGIVPEPSILLAALSCHMLVRRRR